MKLTDEKINHMASELLGLCWHEIKGGVFRPAKCIKGCGLRLSMADYQALRGNFYPDFTHDANAVRELMLWFAGSVPLLEERARFNYIIDLATKVKWSIIDLLAIPPKHITLAVLYAVGQISLVEAT